MGKKRAHHVKRPLEREFQASLRFESLTVSCAARMHDFHTCRII